MNKDLILLFSVLPIFLSFLALLEKALPSLKISKLAALLSFLGGLFLLGYFWEGIWAGEVYQTVVGGWPTWIGIGQQLDGIAWVALALAYLVYLPVLLYSFSEEEYDSRFYFFLLLLQGGMSGIVLAIDVFNLFVFLEITGISAYTLIAYQHKDRAIFAGFKYLMLSSLGITIFLLGVFILYRETGTLSYTSLIQWKNLSPYPRPIAFALATILAGIGVRTAFLPYTWLPDAHGFAPHPISATLSGVVIKVSFIVVWKLVMFLESSGAKLFLLYFGAVIALIGVLRALTQTDVKVLLAWHSVSQMGYVFAGFGGTEEVAQIGSMYHMVSHAFFKALLFLSVGTVIVFTGERSLKKVSGMGKVFPFLSVLFYIGALSIMGIPPFIGYVSKNLLFSGAQAHPFAYGLLFSASIGTVASFTKLSLLFRGQPTLNGFSLENTTTSRLRPSTPTSDTHRLRPLNSNFFWGYASMSLLAIFCLIGGFLGAYGTTFFATIVLGKEASPSLTNPVATSAFLWQKGSEYFKTVITLALGYGLYRFIISSPGKQIQEWANRLRISFDYQLILFLCGLILLTSFLSVV
ncbi:MAG: proton-conducting transporter membrane subunit [Spirochaetales bacterium]